jgi:cytochrome d ubiquinol oxidase subunit II
MLVGAAFALYPMVLLASTDPAYNLTIENTKTGAHGMMVGLVWWSIGIVIAVAYFIFIYRMFRGKIDLEGTGEHGY